MSRVFDNSATQGSMMGDGSCNGEGQGPDLRTQGSFERKGDVLQELSMN